MLKKLSIVLVIVVFSLLAFNGFKSQKLPDDKLISIDNAGDYYTKANQTNYVYQFGYVEKITEIRLDNFKTSSNHELTYKFIDEKMKIGDYNIYGLIIELSHLSYTLESFEIIINESYQEIIPLNLNVIKVTDNAENQCIQTNIPTIGDHLSIALLKFFTTKEIEISKISIFQSAPANSSFTVNSLPFENNVVIKENNYFYIDVDFYYENYLSINCVYIEIQYIDENGINATYTTDVARFGSDLKILENLIL